MPKYAVKVGEIQLRSNKPITEDERRAAIKRLLTNADIIKALGTWDLFVGVVER